MTASHPGVFSSLMRVGVGVPAPMAQSVDMPKRVAMVDAAKAAGAAVGSSALAIKLPGAIPMVDNPGYGALDNMAVVGCVVAVGLGKMGFD